jgi:hypothetical protein
VAFGLLVQSHASDERFEDGAQGWNIDQLAGPRGPSSSTAALVQQERDGTRMVCLGTLLGPEGPGERCLTFGLPTRRPCSRERTAPRGGVGQILVVRPAHQPVRDEPGSAPARTLRTAQWTRASNTLWPS